MEKKMFLKASPAIFEKARELRDAPTHSEMILWSYLKDRLLGYKFRRQHPIGQFILDFYCHELKLAIEADGEVHMEQDVATNDAERQKSLEEQGVSFLRFTNHEIEKQFASVVAKIESYITSHPQFVSKPFSGKKLDQASTLKV